MFVKSLCRRQLTSVIVYAFELQRKPVQIHFGNNYKSARDQISKISTQFNMSKSQSRRAFHFYPEVFKPQSKHFRQFKERVQWVKQINDEKGIGRVLQKHLFDSNHIAFKFSKQQLGNLVAAIDRYFANEAQMQKIFTSCPNLLNAKLDLILEQKVGLLTDYLSISQQQAMKIFETTPFLLPSSKSKLKESIIILNRNYGLSKQEIIEQMKKMGEIFLLGGPVLRDLHKIPIKWGLTGQETKQAFLNNPLLFFNYPYDVLPYKRKILRYLNFTSTMAREMILKHPQILIWSIRSFQQKALFVTNRMQLHTDIKIIQLFTFNFNKILRPRGEILIKSKTTYDNDNIVGYMKLTDQQFCNKINVPIAKLSEEKSKYNPSLQMDFRKSKLLKIIGARQKFIRLASEYQH